MAKLAIIAPRSDILEQAEKLSGRFDFEEVLCLTASGQAVEGSLRRAQEAGADVIIARGMQALLIQQQSAVPVVELYITGQELGLLILRAKEILQKDQPKIALVGLRNMYCDSGTFDSFYNITLTRYFSDDITQLREMAERAIDDGADLLMGGDISCGIAAEHGMPNLFVTSGEESINEALRVAEKVGSVIDLEKANTAEFKTLFEYSFSGILKLDVCGVPVVMNHVAEKLLHRRYSEISALTICQILPEITQETVDCVLRDGEELYARVVRRGRELFIVNIAPIRIGERITGAILSLQAGGQIMQMETAIRKTIAQHGFFAKHSFAQFGELAEPMKGLIATAKIYAKSEAPLLLLGEAGTEKELFAQSLHNESTRKEKPYVLFNCGAARGAEQSVLLFGVRESGNPAKARRGLFELAQSGTLFLEDVERLDEPAQYQLCRFLETGVLFAGEDFSPIALDVRVLASCGGDPAVLVKQGSLRQDLYYALNVLTLTIPPLRARRPDIRMWANHCLEEHCKTHSRYLSLTEDAVRRLSEYPWPGNLTQLRGFCQRLVVAAPRRMVDGEFVASELAKTYPPAGLSEDGTASLDDPEALRIAALLEQTGGDRAKTATLLGISKTTLWRKMQKHQITHRYSPASKIRK